MFYYFIIFSLFIFSWQGQAALLTIDPSTQVSQINTCEISLVAPDERISDHIISDDLNNVIVLSPLGDSTFSHDVNMSIGHEDLVVHIVFQGTLVGSATQVARTLDTLQVVSELNAPEYLKRLGFSEAFLEQPPATLFDFYNSNSEDLLATLWKLYEEDELRELTNNFAVLPKPIYFSAQIAKTMGLDSAFVVFPNSFLRRAKSIAAAPLPRSANETEKQIHDGLEFMANLISQTATPSDLVKAMPQSLSRASVLATLHVLKSWLEVSQTRAQRTQEAFASLSETLGLDQRNLISEISSYSDLMNLRHKDGTFRSPQDGIAAEDFEYYRLFRDIFILMGQGALFRPLEQVGPRTERVSAPRAFLSRLHAALGETASAEFDRRLQFSKNALGEIASEVEKNSKLFDCLVQSVGDLLSGHDLRTAVGDYFFAIGPNYRLFVTGTRNSKGVIGGIIIGSLVGPRISRPEQAKMNERATAAQNQLNALMRAQL